MFVEVVLREETDACDGRVEMKLEGLVEVGPLELKAFSGVRSFKVGHGKLDLVKVRGAGKKDSKFKYVLI